jgi:pilus assembly protein CpaE
MKGARPDEQPRRRSSGRKSRGKEHLSLLATRYFDPGERIKQPRPVRERSDARATLFLACTGGVGSTTLVTTMGAALARSGRRTCIVDLDLQFGYVLSALDLTTRCPISDLLAAPEIPMDRLPRHSTGVFVLSQVGHIDGLGEITAEPLQRLLEKVKRSFDVVLFDGARDFNDHVIAALDSSDGVVVVATADVPALRGLWMRLRVLRKLGYDPQELRLVLNRYSARRAVDRDWIFETIGIEPSFLIPNDFRSVHAALSNGHSLIDKAAGARVTQEIAAMANALYGLPAPTPGSIWQRLMRRRS